MRPNRVRQIWEAGGVAVNGWCAIPSGFTAELMAHMGFNLVTPMGDHLFLESAGRQVLAQMRGEAIARSPSTY